MMENIEKIGQDEQWDYIYEDYRILKEFNQEGFYKTAYPTSIRKSKPIYKKIIKKILNLYENMRYKNKHKHTIFMTNIERFSYLAEVLAEAFNIITVSKVMVNQGMVDCFKYRPSDFDERLYRGFKEKKVDYALEVINDLSKLFARKGVEVVVLSCDRSFLERAMVFAAKKNGLPVVVFQHGIFVGEDVAKTKIGVFGDQYWVWCDYIREKYLESFGYINNDVRLMGYPFEIKYKETVNTKKVLFIGEDYSNLNPEYDELYNQTAITVCKVCTVLGLDFCFRAHPNADSGKLIAVFNKVNNFKFSFQKNLMDDINSSLIVIGDFSSVLFEAALVNKPVIQIDWGEYVHELLKQKMYSFSLKVDNSFEDIKNAIELVLDGKIQTNIDDYYLHINRDFKNDVCKWVYSLLDNKES